MERRMWKGGFEKLYVKRRKVKSEIRWCEFQCEHSYLAWHRCIGNAMMTQYADTCLRGVKVTDVVVDFQYRTVSGSVFARDSQATDSL